VCSEAFVVAHGLQGQAVEILGMAMATDPESTLTAGSCIKIVGGDMTKAAVAKALAQAKADIGKVKVVELHDCFSANEVRSCVARLSIVRSADVVPCEFCLQLVTYEALGLCGEGKAGEFIDKGDNTYGGRVVVNPSGGLISKGHPLGATGLAQCAEICWQLRGEAAERQVTHIMIVFFLFCVFVAPTRPRLGYQVPLKPGDIGLTHNLGLGGAAVVTLYRLPPEWATVPKKRAVSGGAGRG
jgi:sterol carrier protein 2